MKIHHFAIAAAIVLAAGAAVVLQALAPPAARPAQPGHKIDPVTGRRVLNGHRALAFKNVTAEQIIPFIVETTGKVVIPQQDILSRKITVHDGRPVPADKALDMVLLALQQAGIGVIETRDTIVLRDTAEMGKTNPIVRNAQARPALNTRDME